MATTFTPTLNVINPDPFGLGIPIDPITESPLWSTYGRSGEDNPYRSAQFFVPTPGDPREIEPYAGLPTDVSEYGPDGNGELSEQEMPSLGWKDVVGAGAHYYGLEAADLAGQAYMKDPTLPYLGLGEGIKGAPGQIYSDIKAVPGQTVEFLENWTGLDTQGQTLGDYFSPGGSSIVDPVAPAVSTSVPAPAAPPPVSPSIVDHYGAPDPNWVAPEQAAYMATPDPASFQLPSVADPSTAIFDTYAGSAPSAANVVAPDLAGSYASGYTPGDYGSAMVGQPDVVSYGAGQGTAMGSNVTTQQPGGFYGGAAQTGIMTGVVTFGMALLQGASVAEAAKSAAFSGGGAALGFAAGGPIGAVVGSFIGSTVGGMSVLCGELNSQGRLSNKARRIEEVWSLKNVHPLVIRGYHTWAVSYARAMQKSALLSKITGWYVIPRVKEIMYLSGKREKPHYGGKLVRLIFEPMCFAIGCVAKFFDTKQMEWSGAQ